MGRRVLGTFEISTETRGKPPIVNRVGIMEQILVLTHPGLYNKTKKLGLEAACKEAGISKQTFYNWIRADEKLRLHWNEALEMRKESAKFIARENVFEGIDEGSKLKQREKIELSKWVLEKTDTDFNPRQVIEQKSVNMNFDVSVNDIELQLKELFNK